MNVDYLFSLPASLVHYRGVKRLLANAAAFSMGEGGLNDDAKVAGLFCGCDPEGISLGSGGGTVHLLHECYVNAQRHAPASAKKSFLSWLRLSDHDGRVIVHAGGLSRRLPAYATMGKALVPLPPCQWQRGSQLSRTLLSTQVPLFRSLVTAAPAKLRTLIACGDICVHLRGALPSLAPFADSDVLCFGVRTDSELLQKHGVFFMKSGSPSVLEYMLQKPLLAEIRQRVAGGSHSFLLDAGIWMLSDRAVEVLARKCLGSVLDADPIVTNEHSEHGCGVVCKPYDLYSEFGSRLGTNALCADSEVAGLKTSVVELCDAAFLHYGTSRQLISSTEALRSHEWTAPLWSCRTPFNGVLAPEGDGKKGAEVGGGVHAAAGGASEELDSAAGDAMSLLATPSSVIVHNSVVLAQLMTVQCLWVESSWVGARWSLQDQHILVGIPRNDWALTLPVGACVSVVRVLPAALGGCCGGDGDSATLHVAQPYHIDDTFRGDVGSYSTIYMGMPLHDWLSSRGFRVEELYPAAHATDGGAARPLDVYDAALFPVCVTEQQLGDFLYVATLPVEALTGGDGAVDAARLAAGQAVWRTQPRVSSMDLLQLTDVPAMLRNSEYYERRMLALTLALVSADPASRYGCDLTVPVPSRSMPGAAVGGVRSSALPDPMVVLLRQLFSLLDLKHIAHRVVELGVALPRYSGLTEGWDEVDAAGNAVLLSRQPGLTAPVAGGADAAGASMARQLVERGGWGGVGSNAPLCSAPGRIVVAHYHMFVSCVMRVALGAIDTAQPPLSAAEIARRLALLRVESVEEARALQRRHDAAAFAELRAAISESFTDERNDPELGVHLDQIIWGRCPARIDLAGAWSDTPPYTILSGGSVINVAVDLNGQPPVQVYVRVLEDPIIILHSIDSGKRLTISNFEDIRTYTVLQDPFSIPKAALALSGFLPEFCTREYATLQEQLTSRFGGHGMEISLCVAIPAGSGLGTSSIVSGTVLRSLGEFCKLSRDEHDVCRRVLLMEQMLTAGGGWQDQYGGVFEGLKLVQVVPGLPCMPTVRWMPDSVFTDPRYASCHLLYYTGITRTAKGILGSVVREVFLNSGAMMQLLHEMGGTHVAAMYDAITMSDYKRFARLVQGTWERKRLLDKKVCNPEIQAIVDLVEPYVWGLLLPGAGGGGYLYMCAKDGACAARIREVLTANPPNCKARFVKMSVSSSGLQVSRS